MRILFMLTFIFFQAVSIGFASSNVTGNIESIDLNLKDHEVAVTFFGLSDGEATLIQGPNGVNILVNAGGKETGTELKEMLKLYGVNEITALVVTNPQNLFADQINDMISSYKIKELITTPELLSVLTKIVNPNSGIEMITWGEGTTKPLFPDMTAEVLFTGQGENEGLDFTLQFFKHRLFLMTSFSQRSEEKLMKKNLDDVTIFKVPNWAKEDSLSEKLIQYVNPQISIVFESEEHDPDPDIIHDLQDTWSEVYFTKKHGTVTIKFTETNYEVFTIVKDQEE
jgi:beta-lactamase superfamily II metal-dependent hydrolase